MKVETPDDVLDVNRKLLKVLTGRLVSRDVAEAFAAQEFIYVSTFVSPDQIITCETDSAFIACWSMFPNYNSADGLGTPTARVVTMETLSSGRVLVQGSTAINNQLGFGIPNTSLGPQLTGTFDDYDLNAQYFLDEPWLFSPGTVLRASFINPLTLARSGFEYSDQWVLGGYKISLT